MSIGARKEKVDGILMISSRRTHRLSSRRLNDNHLRLLLLHRGRERRRRLSVVNLSAHLALQAQRAAAALKDADRRRDADAVQRALQNALGVARTEAKIVRDGVHAAGTDAIAHGGALRDGAEVARRAAARVDAVADVVKASEELVVHEHWKLRRHDGWLKINSVLPARWSSIRSSVTAPARHQSNRSSGVTRSNYHHRLVRFPRSVRSRLDEPNRTEPNRTEKRNASSPSIARSNRESRSNRNAPARGKHCRRER